MTTTALTTNQLGTYDTGAGTWSAAFGLLVSIGGGIQVWAQIDKTIPLVNIITSLTVSVTPGFTESGTITYYARQITTAFNFSTAIPPNNGIVIGTQNLSLVSATPQVLTLPLNDANGFATTLAADMRSRGRVHAGGGHRFAIGFQWSGTGGTLVVPAFSLTHTPEFTGADGLVATAGTDRAVECPRCGTAVLESVLVKDGVTGQKVCPECYDPPVEKEPWVWPFRS